MQPNVVLSQERLVSASFEISDGEIVYDPFPVTQNGQQLDLTQSKCYLHPERILLNFDLIHPVMREHAKAWIAFACKKYANESLFAQFHILKMLSLPENVKDENEIGERIDELVRNYMESNRGATSKSMLRILYGWFVEECFPFFDEDFCDLYLDTLKFGTDEGKGKDVIMEIANRGPLTLREQRLFRDAMSKINPNELSVTELQGMVALKIGQVLGARDIQVIKLNFKHIGKEEDGAPFILLPRAKQRGHKNNNQFKKRPITKALYELIELLRARYSKQLNRPVEPGHFMLCNLHHKYTQRPINLRLKPAVLRLRRRAIQDKLSLGFIVTNRRLRKTFCTQLIAKGTPLKVVAALMDHSDLQQLDVYYRQTHHVAKKLNEILKSEARDIIDAFKGKVISPEQASQSGQQIFASSKEQTLHLIGSCGSSTPCSLNPPLSCYGCASLEAYEDADHKGVVEGFVAETKVVFGENHSIEILQHKDFLAATKFVQMLERGEI